MRKITFLLLTWPLAIALFAVGLSSCAVSQRAPTLDERAEDLYQSLMCPLCPGETIEQSQTELSKQMRALAREKLEQGATREEILQFFVERYGEGVLAAPIKSGFNLLLWFVPLLALGVGGFFLLRLIRAMQRRAATGKQADLPLSDEERQYWEARLKAELDEGEGKGP